MDGSLEGHVTRDQPLSEADEKTSNWYRPQYGRLSARQPIVDASEAIYYSHSDGPGDIAIQ
jgi:hypothetical protein